MKSHWRILHVFLITPKKLPQPLDKVAIIMNHNGNGTQMLEGPRTVDK